MKIIGCDFHPSYQQIAMVNSETGILWEGRLEHEQGEARRFYQGLAGQTVRVGMEAVGNSQWFEKMLAEMGHELWIGDAAEIRRLVGRKQKTDAGMPNTFSLSCSTDGFRGCGCRAWRSAMCGSCCDTGRSWWRCVRR